MRKQLTFWNNWRLKIIPKSAPNGLLPPLLLRHPRANHTVPTSPIAVNRADQYQVPVTSGKPHWLDYSLTLHGPDATRLACFDNAHQVGGKRRAEPDHKHRMRTIRPDGYRDAAALFADFCAEIAAVMHERGTWP